MGPHLSTLQYCNTTTDISDFARNLSNFTWQDEYRSAGVLNAVVDKGHLVQDPKVVELVGKFFAGFAGDEHGSKLASMPAVYALLVQHCFKYATTPDSVTELGRAISNMAEKSEDGSKLFATTATVNAIGAALDTFAITPASAEALGAAITNISANNSNGKKLFCTPAIRASIFNALSKYADTTSSFAGLCNVIKTLCTDYKPGQKLFSNKESAVAVNNLFAANGGDPDRILELMRAVAAITTDNEAGERVFLTPAMGLAIAKTFDQATAASFVPLCNVIKTLCSEFGSGQKLFSNEDSASAIINLLRKNAADSERFVELVRAVVTITKDNEVGQREFFTPAMGLTIATAFDHATTVAQIERLSTVVREIVFLSEGVTETLFMTPSLVSAFSRVLMSVSVLNENHKNTEAPSIPRVTSLNVTYPLQHLLEGNPIGIKAFAASNEFLDELRRIEDFASASDPDAIRSVRQLRLLLLTETWGGPFVASCFTDPGIYCEYCWCRVLDLNAFDSVDHSFNGWCGTAMLVWFSFTLLPPIPCQMCEAVSIRGALKSKYNIKESQLWMVGACLMPCNAMAQHGHEWRRRGEIATFQGCCMDPSTQVDPNDPVLVANNGPVRPRPKVQVMGEQQEQAAQAAAAIIIINDNARNRPSASAAAKNGNDDDDDEYNGALHVDPNPLAGDIKMSSRQNGTAMTSTYDNRNLPSNDEAQQAAALSHAFPPEACFARGVPNHLSFNDAVGALLSLHELPTDENGEIARPDLRDWIPTNADVDRVVRFIDRQMPFVKRREAVQQLISKSNLADDDIRALILMKMAHPFPVSKFLNAWLAGQRRDNKIAQTAGPIFTRIYRAMEKLPKIKRAATRGVIVGQIPALRATFDNYRTRCAPHELMSFWGFSSFALENSVGSTYFTGSLNQESIIYKADVEGVDMEPFKPDGMPDEAEILPFCPAVFEIVSAEKAGAKLVIKMKQLKHGEFSYIDSIQ